MVHYWNLLSSTDDDSENYVFGEQTLDRLACSLDGKQVLPAAFKYIPQMLGAANNWKERHAALMAISAIGEGCYKIMRNELKSILEMILPYFSDPHPRVRYAACNAAGQLSTDFTPIIQQRFHEQILTKLIPAMDEADFPRVQAHAAAAIVNFSEEASKAVIEPYLNDLFERLLRLLNSSKRYVQEQAITTIATVADSAQDRFRQYYSRIMPLLLNVLQNAKEPEEHRLLRAERLWNVPPLLPPWLWAKKPSWLMPSSLSSTMQGIQQSVTDPDDPQVHRTFWLHGLVCARSLATTLFPLCPWSCPPAAICRSSARLC